MKKLLSTERIDGRVHRTWLHTGDHGQECVTVETVQDVDPVFREVRRMSERQDPNAFFRYRGSVPKTLIDEIAKQSAAQWRISVAAAFGEIMNGKTERAQAVLRMLRDGRDYRKLQADRSGPRYVGRGA